MHFCKIFENTTWFIILGYIDLSKRRVSAEEVVKCEEKFAKAKAVSLTFGSTFVMWF